MSSRETVGCTDYEETEALEKRIAELRDAIAELPKIAHTNPWNRNCGGDVCYCSAYEANKARAHARRVARLEEEP